MSSLGRTVRVCEGEVGEANPFESGSRARWGSLEPVRTRSHSGGGDDKDGWLFQPLPLPNVPEE